ncbi:hypothetical protein [Streptomyces sp. ST2-7A]|uniref:hypothetical protein n=1 Tax=Streptomyces sp. ST2-7A TaxID=2907214 RepID=UPI001F34C5BF|nr:hypothetical protein [Streptomyces sp. ST2-7A]MCE7081326.1 hypothetical protein [Streptomyces sp. ST2-7A]
MTVGVTARPGVAQIEPARQTGQRGAPPGLPAPRRIGGGRGPAAADTGPVIPPFPSEPPPGAAAIGAPATAAAPDSADGAAPAPPAPPVATTDLSYAARLVHPPAGPGADRGPAGPDDDGGPRARHAERWTLTGPEPYVVPLPAGRVEAAHAQVLALSDGLVLLARPEDDGHRFVLLYPSGPGTAEVPLGGLSGPGMRLLPPVPGGRRAYALLPEADATGVWLIRGGGVRAPVRVARVPGRCSGGAWLDREGRLLAVDRFDGTTGLTRAVTVDVATGAGATPLLEIGGHSNDRLLLADPDSGLLLVRSDAPGTDRVGWGVLGSRSPARFPDALHPDGPAPRPLAIQPGQALTPETCAVALHLSGPGGDRVGVWCPGLRGVREPGVPAGWLIGAGWWTAGGELLLPYDTPGVPPGVARRAVPVGEPEAAAPSRPAAFPFPFVGYPAAPGTPTPTGAVSVDPAPAGAASVGRGRTADRTAGAPATPGPIGTPPPGAPGRIPAGVGAGSGPTRPVPLHLAPPARR